MTKVFFYHNAQDKLAAVCSLLGKAFSQAKPMLVYAPQPEIAQTLDRLLWTRVALSFIPHCRADSPLATETPILITNALEQLPQSQRLLNLSLEVPPGFSRFESLIEVVGKDDEDRLPARHRFKFYKDQGYEIQAIDLSQR